MEKDLSSESPRTRCAALLVLLLFAALWFGNLDYRKLVRPDEGRYSEIPREMAATGDWLTPRLNGIKYFEKPPLQYWATAVAYKAFGEHEWTVRAWPALTGFACVLVIWIMGAALFGRAAGAYAAVVLASAMGYMFVAHIATLDMGFSAFMALTMGGLLLGMSERTPERHRTRWIYAAWAGMALAVLSKGLAGIVLPLLVLGLHVVIERDFGIIKRVRPISGGLLFLAIVAPWFVAVSIANPEFPSFFFIHEHFARFLTKVHRRTAPWWYFVPILALGILPWLLTALQAFTTAWRRNPAQPFRETRFLALWAAAIFIFFSASSSKLPSYILPIFPAVALLAGARLATVANARLRWDIALYFAAGLALMIFAPQVERFAPDGEDIQLFAAYVPWLRSAGAIIVTGGACAWLLSERRRTAAVLAIGFSALMAEQTLMMGHEELAPRSSFHDMAVEVRPYLRPGAPFYSVGTYEQTLPFYLKRTVTLVAFADEMAYGLQQEPQLWLPDIAAFERAWRLQGYALAIMPPQLYEQLAAGGLPMREIVRNRRHVVAVTIAGEGK
ncbi:MAG TPA: glycosyltransferase family 39 protein [Burkholderiales bacterium]|nr:glycosyltransferase family 39 protein [Burkholderiales bacterium]